MTVKILIDVNEWYPCYTAEVITADPTRWEIDYAVEVPDDLMQRYRRVMDDFYELQRELERLVRRDK